MPRRYRVHLVAMEGGMSKKQRAMPVFDPPMPDSEFQERATLPHISLERSSKCDRHAGTMFAP